MPEGHVLHRLAGELNRRYAGRAVEVSSPQGRFAVEAERLDGAVLTTAEAVGKHLFIHFDVPEPAWVHIHLGLIGSLRFEPAADVWGQVRLRISDGESAAHLRGPQWCRSLTVAERDAVIARSGPDPLRADIDPGKGFERVRRSRKSIAALLMDQAIAAGVGNIYRAEVLFRHGIRPTTPGNRITRATWDVLWADLAELMTDGREVGRIDTVREEHSPMAQERQAREDPHGGEVYVYRRAGDPCLVCGTTVRTTLLEGRNLYWCPTCQRRTHAVA